MPEEARLFWVDAFASNPFAGNPAAVCLTNEELPDDLKQAIARELNLSETVFIQRQADGYAIRWFTPTREVPLVGHATLAAAHIVLERLEPQRNAVRFLSSASGSLAAYRFSDALAIELPADETQECSAPPDLITGLGAEPTSARVGRHYVALLDSETAVARLKPDFQALARLDRPTIVATAPGARADYVLRFFAPANGVPEDPVSGVAQCSLVPYWSKQLGKSRLVSSQLSPRGGCMTCWMRDDRVVISGPCCTIAEGIFKPAVLSYRSSNI
jgi:PhzF family phenazine biosynthesis protein